MKMRQTVARKLAVLLFVCVWCAPGQERVLTDMAGRKVTVPRQIRKVYCMSPVCTVLVYTLAPELLAGWNYQPDPGEMKWIVDPYRKLPVLGGWFGKNNTGNIEEIIKAHPDVLISAGDVLAVSTAERVQEQSHLPVFVGDASLRHLDKLYLVVGELLGRRPLRSRDRPRGLRSLRSDRFRRWSECGAGTRARRLRTHPGFHGAGSRVGSGNRDRRLRS